MATNKIFHELHSGELIECPQGTFKVTQLIAKGSCCATYVGENSDAEREPAFVALKLFSGHQNYRGALHRENMVLQAVAGEKHIVHHYCSLLTSTGQDVLVQELLSGCVAAIAADLQLEGSTPSAWLLHTLATHAASGLATLHKHGLAHGDIKPHNIMWSADQAAFVLIDFGLSIRIGEQYAHRVHSPEYSSPETRTWNGHIVQQQFEQQRSLHVRLEEVSHPHKETSKGQSTTEDQIKTHLQPTTEAVTWATPIRPGQAADVWALGYTIARIATGAPIFPDGLPSTQEEADLRVMSRLDKLTTSYEPVFLQDLALYVERCLRLCPNERATAAQLSASWSCAASLQPQYFDLNNLPTSVLKIANVADSSLINEEDESDLLAMCDSYGDVLSHRIAQSEGGVIFVRFSTANSAETAVQHLQRKEWRGRTLVPTFYPILLYQQLATEEFTETG